MKQGFQQLARTWALPLGLGVLLAACAAPPELAYPSGQGKKPLTQAIENEAPKFAQGETKPQVLAHDAPDIQRLSDALAQLQAQISEAQAGGTRSLTRSSASALVPQGMAPSGPKAAPSPFTPFLQNAGRVALANKPAPQGVIQVQPPNGSQVFQLEPGDTTLVGVLLRWARQAGWQMRLNGTWVDGQRFPQHPVPYADLALERPTGTAPTANAANAASSSTPGLEPAVAALLQAHSRFQNQISLSLSLLADKAELQVNSQAVAPLLEKP